MVYILVLERVASHPLATLAEKYSVLSTVLQYYLVQYLSVYVCTVLQVLHTPRTVCVV